MNRRAELQELDEFLTELNGEPLLFKHSDTYESNLWVTADKCHTYYPIQRKLGKKECVFDLDHVSKAAMSQIPKWLEAIDFKFQAWQSSDDGMHIHFWTEIEGKEQKKLLVQEMARRLEERFGVKNDLGPMGHGHIRTEYSVHPRKLTTKILITSNLTRLFYINDVSPSIKEKVLKMKVSDPSELKSNSGERDGKCPTCMKYILGHRFADGRKRMMFVVASWYKGSGLDDKAAAKKTWEWCQSQGHFTHYSKVWATVNSSNGTVGCRYRHSLLEEIGVDMTKCEWEVKK